MSLCAPGPAGCESLLEASNHAAAHGRGTTSDEWSDREHIHAPRGPLLIAAPGRVLPLVGIYRGYGELMQALLDGRCLPRSRTPANEVIRRRMLMAVVELRRAGVLSLLMLGRERI